MKWLILLILISCGKHQEPGAQDMRDNDGDQIINSQESETDREVANIEPLGKVTGVLKVDLDKSIELPFSNKVAKDDLTLGLITMNEKQLRNDDYFTEWSKLILEKRDLKFEKNLYSMKLVFTSDSDKAEDIVIISGKGIVPLGKWDRKVEFNITAEQLRSLVTGTSYLALRKKFRQGDLFQVTSDETIRTKTYRIHYFDGEKSSVLYVSKSLSFEDLRRMKKIDAKEIKNEDEIFFSQEFDEKKSWFYRESISGEKILAYTDMRELKKHFMKRFDFQKVLVTRENGVPVRNLLLKNKKDAKVFLRVRAGGKTKRRFIDSQEGQTYRVNGGRDNRDEVNCTHYIRSSKEEADEQPDIHSFLTNLKSPLESAQIEERYDEKGVFWDLKTANLSEDQELSLTSRSSATYKITGLYHLQCNGDPRRKIPISTVLTNDEGKLSFEVESYVEKID